MRKRNFVIALGILLISLISIGFAKSNGLEGYIVTYEERQLTIKGYDGQLATYTLPENVYINDQYGIGLVENARVELEKDINGNICEVEIKPEKRGYRSPKQGHFEVKGTIENYINQKLTVKHYDGKIATYILPANVPVKDKYNIGLAVGARVELKLKDNTTIIMVDVEPRTYEIKGYITQYADNQLTLVHYDGTVDTYDIPRTVFIEDKFGIGFVKDAFVELEMDTQRTIYKVKIKPSKH